MTPAPFTGRTAGAWLSRARSVEAFVSIGFSSSERVLPLHGTPREWGGVVMRIFLLLVPLLGVVLFASPLPVPPSAFPAVVVAS
jgi:hypothetical protein